MQALIRLDVLIVDDLALRQMDPTETHDSYDLIVERHRKTSTILTSNRAPDKPHGFAATYAR